MGNTVKKVVFALIILLVVTSTGAWQGVYTAAAADAPGTPLAAGLSWKELGVSNRDLQINMKGDALRVAGQGYQATEVFTEGVPQEVSDFYSNVELFKAGWTSDNAYEDEQGVHKIFYHESGYYLAIDFVKCQSNPSATCVKVWLSQNKGMGKVVINKSALGSVEALADPITECDPAAVVLFCKGYNYVYDGIKNINPSNVKLKWADDPASKVEKYSYCVKESGPCVDNDPNWTGTYLNKSVSISGLNFHKVYYWQVKGISCMTCATRKIVYADSNTWWKFTTAFGLITLKGNVGTAGVKLTWLDTDNSTKSVYSDNTGAYAMAVSSSLPANTPPINWTFTVTPTKTYWTFDPASRTYVDAIASLTGQNFKATEKRCTISGNAGIGLAILSHVEGTTRKSVSANMDGDYSLTVPIGWSGAITPSSLEAPSFTAKPGTETTYTCSLVSGVPTDYLGQDYYANEVMGFTSNGSQDGFVKEWTEFSSVGGAAQSTANTFGLGDTALNQQLRGILSFDTTTLPVGAVIVAARIRLKAQTFTGVNPLGTHGFVVFDIASPSFGGIGLAKTDFEAAANLKIAGTLNKTPVGGFYRGALSKTGLTFIGVGSTTQIRLRFQIDDNNNHIQDSIMFYSGNEVNISYRPVLEVVYYIP